MNFVRAIFGEGVTVTWNEQVAVRLMASVAVHSTVVTPIGKLLPLVCVQAKVTGCVPASTRGAPKMIEVPASDVAVSPTLGGQLMTGGSATTGGRGGSGGGGTGVGDDGVLQAATTNRTSPRDRLKARRATWRWRLRELWRSIDKR
jgi:hypothetical protein